MRLEGQHVENLFRFRLSSIAVFLPIVLPNLLQVMSDKKRHAMLAAQSAVQDMGGRIVHASNQAGSIAAHLDAEGNTVRLDVTLSKGPGTEGNEDYPVDVSAHASLVGIDDLDPGMREQLGRIVEEYLRFLEQRARPRR